MRNDTFAHLHLHSEYSQLDGFGSAESYVKKAKELGFEYLACTDHGNIDGLLTFQKECDKQKIKPIMGCEVYIVPDANIKRSKEDRGHIIILVKNQVGWIELCKLLTYANLTGFYHKPRIDYNSLLEADLSGFVILTGCGSSFLHLKGGRKFFEDLIEKNSDIYFEIMPHDIPIQKEIHSTIKKFRQDLPFPLVATNDCHYITSEDWKAQEVLLAIQTKAKWTDKDRFRFGFQGLHLRTADEMAEAFERQKDFSRAECLFAMRNTIRIAKQCCNFRILKQNISLPSISPDWEKGEHYHELERLVYEGLDIRKINKAQRDSYHRRIKLELDLIKKKGFARYFLIVLRLVKWAKEKNIMIGPGRGSVGGSLVAYLVGITQVDPLEYRLIFERFIAEDRTDYPDIDIDFEDVRREEIIQYLEDFYGKYNTSGISTFSRMRAKGVIRDVARVFGVSYKEVDVFAKMIEVNDKKDVESFVDLASKETSEGKMFRKKYPEVTKLAIQLEGQIKNSGQHPAAVIISEEDLRNGKRGNLCLRKNRVMCNWGMQDSEYMGLMKLDILGLNTLTVLNECARLVYESSHKRFIFEDIPLDDEKVFEAINKGNTFGMFQLSASPTTELVKEIKINKFMDIAAIIALVRPGPFDSGMTKEYIKRRKKYTIKGRTWELKNKIYEKITEETYGILVYQEQVMQVISQVAGLSYTIADKIRKVIAKKREAKEFKQYWEMFLSGCLKNQTMDEAEAEEFWEGLQKWASYGFNKAHSVEYALIAYWTGYCKIYYPTEFICAYLSFGTELGKEDLLAEAMASGLQVVPPKIGISDSYRWVVKGNKLYIPFIEIKGVGDKAAIKCVAKKTVVKKQIGFFDQDIAAPIAKTESALGKLLQKVDAYNSNSCPPEAQELFSFSLSGNQLSLYPKLKETLSRNFLERELPAYLRLDFSDDTTQIPNGLIQKKRFRDTRISDCKKCDLRQGCKQPILPSQGIWNVAIIGEAPGPKEDKYNRGFHEEAPAGELLWNALKKHGYKRLFFHVTNVCKCYPKETRTPTKVHILACSGWIEDELKQIDCKLLLAFGNTAVNAFTSNDSGITRLSGETEWNERLGLWICWCIHPAAVKHNPGNKHKFEAGIENFIDKLEMLRK